MQTNDRAARNQSRSLPPDRSFVEELFTSESLKVPSKIYLAQQTVINNFIIITKGNNLYKYYSKILIINFDKI